MHRQNVLQASMRVIVNFSGIYLTCVFP